MLKSVVSLFTIPFCVAIFFTNSCFAENEIIVSTSDDIDISVERFPSSGKYLMIWLAPEYGFRSGHRTMARRLSEQNIEVWQSNIVDSLFLPQSTRSVKQLDGKYVADVIEYAYKKTGKKIVVAGDSYATVTALLGARQWQQRKHKNPYFIGAVLFSPYTYAYIPPLGLAPEYLPIVSATNIPMVIYQAKNSGTTGQFNLLLKTLQQHNSPVYTKFVPQVMSLFYEDPPTKDMVNSAKPLPRNIKQMIAILEKHDVPAKTVPLKDLTENKSGIDIYLREFKGDNTPIAINLKDINGKNIVKNSFKGQITIINFWATWCPPCVEEIPSLNRLKKKMKGHPFELISINYAEDKDTILNFMKKVNVEFTVLLDKNGDFANKLNVITYPSTFVIDTNGNIKYGVNAAIEWDNPEILQKLKLLLN